jgi:uroporphyrinogen decarboxylase
VLGFVGSPWTLATYVIEGGSSGVYKKIKTMSHTNPELLDALLTKLADSIATYSKYQIRSGAHCIQLFDSWGGQLPPKVGCQDPLRCCCVTVLHGPNAR